MGENHKEERREEKRRNVDLSGISMIVMPVRPTLGTMSTGHNINGARLLTPFRGGHYSNQGNQSDHGITA